MMIKINIEIAESRLSDLLCTALEGGSNYWYSITENVAPRKYVFRTDPDRLFKHLDNPINPGGSLLITTIGGDEINGAKEWRLDREALERGLHVMARKYPRHFADFLDENEDAETGDVFLQCCLFGELVYG